MQRIFNFLWRGIAWVLSQPSIADWLIRRAMRTPYSHIASSDGTSAYMGRWWLFNPYPAPGEYQRKGWRDWMPSIRVHHIVREDRDRHLHDHPWNARTIVLRGWYREHRRVNDVPKGVKWFPAWDGEGDDEVLRAGFLRERGYTGRLMYGEYHRITKVPDDGVWTLFFTWQKRGTWGFLVDGVKVPWREYLNAGKKI